MNIFEILNNAFTGFVQSLNWGYAFTVILFTFGFAEFFGIGKEDFSLILFKHFIKITARFQKKMLTVLMGIFVAVAFYYLEPENMTKKSLFMSFPAAVFFYDYIVKWIIDRIKSQFARQTGSDAPAIPLNPPPYQPPITMNNVEQHITMIQDVLMNQVRGLNGNEMGAMMNGFHLVANVARSAESLQKTVEEMKKELDKIRNTPQQAIEMPLPIPTEKK